MENQAVISIPCTVNEVDNGYICIIYIFSYCVKYIQKKIQSRTNCIRNQTNHYKTFIMH